MIVTNVVYAEGGYDPTKPNDNIVSIEEIDVPDEAPAADVVAVIESMTPTQLDALRTALGLA